MRPPTCGNQHLAANIWRPAIGDQHLATNIWQPTFGDQHLAASMQQPACGDQHAATSMQQPTCSNQHAVTNMQRPACSDQHAMTNIREQHAETNMQIYSAVLSSYLLLISACSVHLHVKIVPQPYLPQSVVADRRFVALQSIDPSVRSCKSLPWVRQTAPSR
jgi:hypothetical protein